MWHMMLDIEAVAFTVIVASMVALAVAVRWPALQFAEDTIELGLGLPCV